MSGLIVIGYDASAVVRHAIETAAPILRATEAVVVHVWTPRAVAPTSMPLQGAPPPPSQDDAVLETAAWRVAEEGAALAVDVGLDARPEVRSGAAADVGGLLAVLADERDADLVLVGRRPVSRLEAVVFGSVSHDTVRASHCPVLVVTLPGN